MFVNAPFFKSATLAAALLAAWTIPTSVTRGDDMAASQFVQLALAHEAHGKHEIGRHLLEAALLQSPDYAPAHWQLGHVQVDGEWQPVAEAYKKAAQCNARATYQKLREEALDDPRREMSLAKWCRRQGWEDHEKLHYSRVALNEAAHPRLRLEARRKLDLVTVNGEVMAEEDLEHQQQEAQRVAAATKAWRGRLAAWEQAIAGNDASVAADAAYELDRVEDPAVIHAVESFVPDAEPRFGRKLVALLGRFPQYASTQALVRFAVQSPFEEVREAATTELQRRPLHDFVPTLLDQLVAPVASNYQIAWTRAGLLRYTHRFIRRTADANYVVTFDHLIRPMLRQATGISVANWRQSFEGIAAFAQSRNQFLRSISRVRRRLLSRERALARTNWGAGMHNDVVVKVLERTTGEVLGNDPAQWQSWWERYNEVEQGKPTYYAYYPTSSTYSVTVDPSPPTSSCFSAGTPVWTEAGLAPIETVRVGDRVLSQDLDSGELTYKLVLRTTALPPTSETVRVTVDAESVDMTKAHVVWVAGEGWRMAKELEPGDHLQGVSGSTQVYAVDELPPELEVYNLVVADFNTFFVGEGGMLVHDITYVSRRRPTTALVPGFTPDEPRTDAPTASSSAMARSIVQQVYDGLRQ